MVTDFVQYWAAAKLYAIGGNPYSPVELLDVERQAGWSDAIPLLMWNPPWALPLILPLGWLDYHTARFLWFVAHALTVMLVARALWKIFRGSLRNFHYAWIAVLTFAPIHFVLLFGQIGPLVVLGLAGFLFFSRKEQWLCAGASLIIAAIKPHLIYLLWPAVVLWLWGKSRARIAPVVLGAAVIAALPLALNLQIYAQYLALIQDNQVVGLNDWPTPTLGMALAQLFPASAVWIRWMPSLVGTLWFLWYWQRHSLTWEWVTELPLLLVVSAATTGFAWTYDYVVLLPALLQCAAWTTEMEPKRRRIIIGVHALLTAILVGSKIAFDGDLLSISYFWLPLVLLIFYICVRAVRHTTLRPAFTTG
jgi:hypothetical protein